MGKLLVVVDMQNDFIDGALGTPEAQAIVPGVVEKMKEFDGTILATQDTHSEDYLNTQEGRKLPVAHCIRGTKGWELRPEIAKELTTEPVEKPTFGSMDLIERIRALQEEEAIDSVTLVGLCTDICVISNAMLIKAAFPELPVQVEADLCAGVTPQSHENALEAMKMCQIEVI